jgi:hypothetical protein
MLMPDGSTIDADARVAARRGNAVQTVSTRYTDASETTEISRDEMVTSLIYYRGNVVQQTTDSYIGTKLATSTFTNNVEIDNRGNSKKQEITTKTTDSTGTKDSLEETAYQEFTNRTFDSAGRVTNQKIYNYLDSTKALVLDVQEIRSFDFDARGASTRQKIATYVVGNAGEEILLDGKEITSSDVDAMGYYKHVETVTYDSAELKGDDIALSGLRGTQVVDTATFDVFGNAIDQTSTRKDSDGKTIDSQRILSSGFDFHNRASSSSITTFTSTGDFASQEQIAYLEYDRYGNVKLQTVDTFDAISGGNLLDHKRISSVY